MRWIKKANKYAKISVYVDISFTFYYFSDSGMQHYYILFDFLHILVMKDSFVMHHHYYEH